MSESCGFFDAEELLDGTYDREYAASEWANYFKLFIGNGVFATPTNQLKVRAVSGMTIKVLEGWAFLNGFWYHNDGDLEIAVPPNLTANTQNHGIFVQFDSSERTIAIVLGENRTQVDRTAPIWELKIGEVAVPAAATSVTDANITDTRAITSVCGFVTGLIDIINTEDLFVQYQTIFNEWIAGVEAEEAEKAEEFDVWMETEQQDMESWENTQKSSFESWKDQQTDDFDAWFDEMKGQLSTDAAGNLQNQINFIEGSIAHRELTSSASRDYDVDEYIYWDGAFYRVKINVTQGTAWDNTANTGNIEPMSPLTVQIKKIVETAGDMYKEDYDEDEEVLNAGGIPAYVEGVTDDWTPDQTLSVGDTTATFNNLDSHYAYAVFFDCADGVAPPTLAGGLVFNETSATANFSAVTSEQVGTGDECTISLRIFK